MQHEEPCVSGSYQFLSSPDRGSGQFSLQVSWLRMEPWALGRRTGLEPYTFT
jgi:hypothetical protein